MGAARGVQPVGLELRPPWRQRGQASQRGQVEQLESVSLSRQEPLFFQSPDRAVHMHRRQPQQIAYDLLRQRQVEAVIDHKVDRAEPRMEIDQQSGHPLACRGVARHRQCIHQRQPFHLGRDGEQRGETREGLVQLAEAFIGNEGRDGLGDRGQRVGRLG